MRVLTTTIPGVLVIEPERFPDARGLFVETWSRARYAAAGIGADFVQDNLARSKGGVLRGLHVQRGRPQGKLVRVLRGEIFDVAVDVRPGSPTFGAFQCSVGSRLSLSASSACCRDLPASSSIRSVASSRLRRRCARTLICKSSPFFAVNV